MSLILISGPARSGKSLAGSILAERLGADCFALSDILKDMTHKHFGVDVGVSGFERVKDIPVPEFDFKTPREAYIWFSEDILKPCYGEHALGSWALSRVKDNLEVDRPSIVTGVGFKEEVAPLIDAVGKDKTYLITVECSPLQTVTDSRSVLRCEEFGVSGVTIPNCFTPAYFDRITQLLERGGSDLVAPGP